MIQSRWSQNILLGFLVVVLALLSLWGWNNGVKAAQSKRVVKDAQAMTAGFTEFYKDQNRYPATTEFTNNNLLRPYIANFPPQTFPSKTCPNTFDYYNASPQTYELRFCLSKAVSGFNIGWNTLKP
ncbi:MAG TPA: hypothetical protein VHQ41_00090 [Patescibacteria group bacterium]|jgi:hypothetical protein|nr:hypothetical protein [Patescibacteria group bacterium]